jgi:hypothetical protein
MTIKIENETHWRSADIKRVIQAVIDANGSPSIGLSAEVGWARSSTVSVKHEVTYGRRSEVPNRHVAFRIKLPRRGPKNHHDNPMLAIALSASLTGNETVFSMQEAFRMTNVIGHIVACLSVEPTAFSPTRLRPDVSVDAQPTWAPIETFMIQKYKDPKLDGTFRDFVAKKEKALTRADQDMKRAEVEAQKAMRRLKKAQARKKAAERSLQAARDRRS